MRVGFGYDSHVFDEGRPLRLGGVLIPDAPGLRGHSDADALVHALVDALYGAAALGDIGSNFPDTDARWRGADSAQLLATVVAEAKAAGWTVGNVDAAVICERPKIGPRVADIRRRLARLLWPDDAEAGFARVSVKGKTNERIDDIGAGLGIEVHAVCLLKAT